MKNKNTVISVKNVKKGFKIYYDKGHTLKERLLFFKSRNAFTKHEVLKGVSLDIKKGDVVGLVGHNGCGKSTLLKLITKIIYPDSGSIEINGKISSLLELGAGFHPDMTGRENVYINASIYGLTKKEIDNKIDSIIEFSELEDFIDSPVRTYSSGMYMRLAFSVAINVEADILLIDEILAVGDANFQAKCFRKMQELKKNGITIVIVSHDLGSIERLCNKAVWIEEGLIREIGNPHDISAKYLEKIMRKNEIKIENKTKNRTTEESKIQVENSNKKNNSKVIKKDDNRTGNREVQITSVKIVDRNNEERTSFKTNENIKIIVNYERNNKNLNESVVGFGVFRYDGINCYGTNTYIDNFQKMKLKDSGIIEIELTNLKLLDGEYDIDIAFHDEYGSPYDYIRKVKKIKMYSNIKEAGIFRIDHKFKHLEGDGNGN